MKKLANQTGKQSDSEWNVTQMSKAGKIYMWGSAGNAQNKIK